VIAAHTKAPPLLRKGGASTTYLWKLPLEGRCKYAPKLLRLQSKSPATVAGQGTPFAWSQIGGNGRCGHAAHPYKLLILLSVFQAEQRKAPPGFRGDRGGAQDHLETKVPVSGAANMSPLWLVGKASNRSTHCGDLEYAPIATRSPKKSAPQGKEAWPSFALLRDQNPTAASLRNRRGLSHRIGLDSRDRIHFVEVQEV